MSIELRRMLVETAAVPRRPVALADVIRRGEGLRRRRVALQVAVTVFVAVGGWTSYAALVSDRSITPTPTANRTSQQPNDRPEGRWTPNRDSASGYLTYSRAFEDELVGVSWGDGIAWVLTCSQPCVGQDAPVNLSTIDPDSGETLRREALPAGTQLTFGYGALWVIDSSDSLVMRIDPETLDVMQQVRLTLPFEVAPGDRAFLPSFIAVGEGYVWVDTARGALAQIDPQTMEIVSVRPIGTGGVGEIAIGHNAIWVADGVAGVMRIDPISGNVVATIPLVHDGRMIAAESLAASENAVWVGGNQVEGVKGEFQTTDRGAVAMIDPTTTKVGSILEVRHFARVVATTDFVWVLDGRGVLWRVDPSDQAALGEGIEVGVSASLTTDDAGAAWVIRRGSGQQRLVRVVDS